MITPSSTLAAGSRASSSEPNFDRVAHIYKWAEYLTLGPLLQRTREEFLPAVIGSKQALVLGDGDGRFTAALLASAPQIRVRAVDISASMLALVQQRCHRLGAASRLQTHHRSALTAQAPRDTDLIVTHFFLDCLSQQEVDLLASNLARQVSPGCLWLLSDFGLPTNRLLRPFAAAYIRLLYLAFRVLTGLRPQRLPDSQNALRAAGFTRLCRKERLRGLLYSELWQRNPAQPETGAAQPLRYALPSTCK